MYVVGDIYLELLWNLKKKFMLDFDNDLLWGKMFQSAKADSEVFVLYVSYFWQQRLVIKEMVGFLQWEWSWLSKEQPVSSPSFNQKDSKKSFWDIDLGKVGITDSGSSKGNVLRFWDIKAGEMSWKVGLHLRFPQLWWWKTSLRGGAPPSVQGDTASLRPKQRSDLEHRTTSLWACVLQWFLHSALPILQALSELWPKQLWLGAMWQSILFWWTCGILP